MTDVLLSIRPKYVDAILIGSKQYEFRKQIFREIQQPRIFIYSTSPVKKIVACFFPGEIIEDHPDNLWKQFGEVSGLDEADFFNYYEGKQCGYAIRIDELEQFHQPLDPKAVIDHFVPPQSFCYVKFANNSPIGTQIP